MQPYSQIHPNSSLTLCLKMLSGKLYVNLRRQGGRVVRVLDFESVGPGFESHSEHFKDLFHSSPEL